MSVQHFPNHDNLEKQGVFSFCKVILLIYECNIDKNIFTEFLAITVFYIVVENGTADALRTQTHPGPGAGPAPLGHEA